MPDLRSMAKILGIELYPENMPQWAQDLTDQVCMDYNIQQPKITWRSGKNAYHSQYGFTTGVSWNHEGGVSKKGKKYLSKTQISIVTGTDERHVKLILLHELAHQIMPDKEGHSETFWICAYNLYRRYGVDMRYAYDKEKAYKDMARTIGAEYLAGIW